MKCFICNKSCELYIPDRDSDSMVIRPICNYCLDEFIKVFPTLLQYVLKRKIGLKS